MNTDITYSSNNCAFKAECNRHMSHHLPSDPDSLIWTAEFRTRGSLAEKCGHFIPRRPPAEETGQ